MENMEPTQDQKNLKSTKSSEVIVIKARKFKKKKKS